MRPERILTSAVGQMLSVIVGASAYGVVTLAAFDRFFGFLAAAALALGTRSVTARLDRRFWEGYQPVTPPMNDIARYLKGLVTSVLLALIGAFLGWGVSEASGFPTALSVGVGAAFGFAVGQVVFFVPSPGVRGMPRYTEEKAIEIADEQRDASDRGWPLGNVCIPALARNLLFLFVGSPRTGKTTLMENLMREVASFIGKRGRGRTPHDWMSGGGVRMVVADPKSDNLSKLAAVVRNAKIISPHPYDDHRKSTSRIVRCCAFDLGADSTDLGVCQTIAAALSPIAPQAHEPFWGESAQLVTGHALWALRLSAGEDFGLSDLVRILEAERPLKYLLNKYTDTRSALAFIENNETGRGIMMTVASKIAQLEPVAWAWENSPHRFRLDDFIEGEGVLMLPNHPIAEGALQAINRVIVTRLGQYVLSPMHSAKKKKSTWFFLDETNNLGNIANIHRLITQAPGLGAVLVLAIHSDELLKLVYSEASAAIRGQIGNIVSFRVSEPETAEVLQELYGSMELLIGGRRDVVPTVSKSELQALRWSDGPDGIEAFFGSAVVGGAWKSRFTREEMAKLRIKPDPKVEDFCPRPIEELRPRAFTKEDLDRLGLPHCYLKDFEETLSQQEGRQNRFEFRYRDLGLLTKETEGPGETA